MSTNNFNKEKILAPPGYLAKSRDTSPKYREFLAKEKQRAKDKALKLKQERTQLWDSVWFERNYYVPFDKFDQFMTDPNFDIEYYSYDSYAKRDKRKREISDFAYGLLYEYQNNYIENQKHNPNTLYYLNTPFITNYVNRDMIRTVLEKVNEKFGNEAKDFDFLKEDYEYGEDDMNPIDPLNDEFYEDYDDSILNHQEYFDSDSE